MREDFSSLQLPDKFRQRYTADRERLFDLIRGLVSDEVLKVIARQDYDLGVEQYYLRLREIRDLPPKEPIGYVREVLSLTRWGTTRLDGLSEIQTLIARAFSSVALIRLREEIYDDPYADENLIVLIDSCHRLGSGFADPLRSLIVSVLDELKPWDADYLAWHLGFILCFVHDGPDRDDVTEILGWYLRAREEVLPWWNGMTNQRIKFLRESLSVEIWQQECKALEPWADSVDGLEAFLTEVREVRAPTFGAIAGEIGGLWVRGWFENLRQRFLKRS